MVITARPIELGGFVFIYMKIKEVISMYCDISHRRYKFSLHQFSDFIHNKEIGQVGKMDFDEFEKYLKTKYMPMTVKDKLTIVKTFYNYCYSSGYIKYNPRYLRIPKVMCRRVVLEWGEFNKMCSVLNSYNFQELRLLLIMRFLAMGLRVGEVAKLNISDFNMMGPERMYTIIESEKSKRERVISWNKDTHELLVRYLGTRICLNKQDWLFGTTCSNPRHNRVTTRTIERWFLALKNRVGIQRPVTPHSVRHMAAHIMLDSGADIKAIQIKLGHSSIMSTDHYLNLDPLESVKTLSRYKLV